VDRRAHAEHRFSGSNEDSMSWPTVEQHDVPAAKPASTSYGHDTFLLRAVTGIRPLATISAARRRPALSPSVADAQSQQRRRPA
jgi:hypothetical protein